MRFGMALVLFFWWRVYRRAVLVMQDVARKGLRSNIVVLNVQGFCWSI